MREISFILWNFILNDEWKELAPYLIAYWKEIYYLPMLYASFAICLVVIGGILLICPRERG